MKRQNATTITFLSLPKEIIHEEILPRFPVKSLLRFRCVSKSWGSLIGSKRFIKTHHQNSRKNPSFPQQRVILQKLGDLTEQCSLPFLSKEPIYPSPLDDPTVASSRFMRVLGCYNGLVCVRKFPRELWLWNPSTRISKKLPNIIANDTWYVQYGGFGWDETSGEYMVFLLVHNWDLPSRRGEVYSSKTKSWKTIEYNFADLPCYCSEAGVFVSGKLHWRNPKNDDVIIFMDLKSEVFGRIELPFYQEHSYEKRVGQIGSCLCVLNWNGNYNGYIRGDVRVWVMKEYGVNESWERLVNLSLDHELLQRPFSVPFARKGCNGEIFVFHGSTLLVYDPRDNVFRFPEVCCR